jgi:hypothetical protein
MQNLKRNQSPWVMVVAAALLFAMSWVGVRGWPFGTHAVSAAQGAAEGHSVGSSIGTSAALSRTLAFPAYCLSVNSGSPNIQRQYDGLRWKYTYAEVALLAIPRPADWDGASDIQMRIFFRPTTNASGTVRFFVRPRAYDPGDTYQDMPAINSDMLALPGHAEFGQLTITIPAYKFGAKAWWYLPIQRESVGPTYPDDVVVISVALEYRALSPLSSAFLPYASRQ